MVELNGQTEITIYQGEVIEDRALMPYQGDASRGTDLLIERWLEAKASRSKKTYNAYAVCVKQLREQLQARGLDLFSEYRAVSLVIRMYVNFYFDHKGKVIEGRQPSESTINQRLSALGSFYTYVHRFDDRVKNPVLLCDRVKRQVHDAATYLGSKVVADKLQSIDRAELAGKRDYALLVLAVTTGRRAAELTALVGGDIRVIGQVLEVTWRHCKGGKTMKDHLGAKTRAALEEYLYALYGKRLGTLDKDAPLFVSLAYRNRMGAMSIQAVSNICRRYLGTGKVHTTRHDFAIANQEAGASLSEISERLGHSDEKTTSIYLKRLHGAENKHIEKLEALFEL